MDCRKWGSHARGVYRTQYTLPVKSKGQTRVKNRNKNNGKRTVRKVGEKERRTKEETPKLCLIRVEVLNLILPEGATPPTIDQTKITNLTYSLISFLECVNNNSNILNCTNNLNKRTMKI